MLKALIVFLFTGWRDVKYFSIPSYVVRIKIKYPTYTKIKIETGLYFSIFDRFEYVDRQNTLHFSKKLHPEIKKDNSVIKTIGRVDEFEVVSWKKLY